MNTEYAFVDLFTGHGATEGSEGLTEAHRRAMRVGKVGEVIGGHN